MVTESKAGGKLSFGSPAPGVHYADRRAAYVVIFSDDGRVAMVKGFHAARGNAFLPGGGSQPGEAPEETVAREVAEELARGVRLTSNIGEVTQYFYSNSDDQHYRMQAVFFAGEFLNEVCATPGRKAEHELYWLPVTELKECCFHACHAWAVREVVTRSARFAGKPLPKTRW